MLRVAPLSDRTGRYYLADPARELGGGDAGPAPGRWTGAAARGLGLEGAPAADPLARVLSGRHPQTGRPLVARTGSVAGYDLTFAAPKSVSALFALGGTEAAAAVLAAHRAAVDGAVGYVAERAVAARRVSGGEAHPVAVDGVVAASFTHGVSRALDPHVHSHVVVANLVHGADGRWSALDGRGLFAHSRAAGALYDAHLRHVLGETLGVGWESRAGGPYEVAGVRPELVGALSRRRAEILLAAFEHPAGAAAGRVRASVVTRDAKVVNLDPVALRRGWRRLADDVGAGDLEVASLARSPADGRGADVDEHRFAAALSAAGPRGVTRRDVVAAWAGAVAAGTTAADVEVAIGMLVDFGAARGVAERAVAVSEVSPSPWHVRALGPRPADPGRLATWTRATTAIDAYRRRWPPTDRRLALGIDATPSELARVPVRRLAEHLSVLRQVRDARRCLGREPETPGLGRVR